MSDLLMLSMLDGIKLWFAKTLEEITAFWDRGVQWFASPDSRLLVATAMLTIGLYVFMPGVRRSAVRVIGAVVGGLGIVILLSLVPASTISAAALAFATIATLTVVAAVGTVSSKSPIYCAIWFAVTLFGVGSLFLLNGAQFLGIATVAVYAGAIVVTLLFVLMLAQPDGHTHYDRISWGWGAQWLGCFAGAACACMLIWAFLNTPVSATGIPVEENPILAESHVAVLGGTMFSRYLIAVQIGGMLLFAALVGAVSIAAVPTGKIDRQIDRALGSSAPSGGFPHE